MGIPDEPRNTEQGIGSHAFYVEQTTTNAYVEIPFMDALPTPPAQFTCYGIRIESMNANSAFFSYDGVTDHGRIDAASVTSLPQVYENVRKRSIWIKAQSAGSQALLRLTVW